MIPYAEDMRKAPLCGPNMSDPGDDSGGDDAQVGVATKTRAKPKKPSQFKVLLLNDDYTPMEFVVMVIQEYFNKDHETATRIMLQVHLVGKGVCGIFTRDVAATKVHQVIELSREAGHPLQCTMEEA